MKQGADGHRMVRLGLLLATCSVPAIGACKPFPDTACAPCEDECPDYEICHATLKQCVPRNQRDACDRAPTGLGGQTSASDENFTGAAEDRVDCDQDTPRCIPRILTPRELTVDCAGREFSITFEAACHCDPAGTPREVRWSMTPELPNLTMSEDGELSGNPRGGVSSFEVSALIDEAYPVADEFTLTVVDRCWVLFLAEDGATGKAQVAAAHRASGEPALALPHSGGTDATVTRFDISPDGRFLAQVVQVEKESRLDVLELQYADVQPKPLDYSGHYVAHAFSQDSRWLALVAAQAEGAGQMLHLIDLAAGAVVDTKSLVYHGHLTWSDTDEILYYGSLTDSAGAAAQEQLVGEAGLMDRVEHTSTRLREGEEFYGFSLGEAGFLGVYDRRLTYVDRRESRGFEHPPATSLSPGLEWVVHSYATGMRVDRLADHYALQDPFTTASECHIVRAWARNGSKFLCSNEQGVVVYATRDTRGPLPATHLDIPGGYQSIILRAAFSDSGQWLALVPNDEGLLVVDEGSYSNVLDVPALGRPTGTNEWDFFFTPREEHLIVQQGRVLWIAPLSTTTRPGFVKVEGVTLPSVPACTLGWFPHPDEWCGAPRFRGNFALSGDDRYLAFADVSADVRLIDLSTLQMVPPLGNVSRSCSSNCIQFQ